jgi:hypothetical protein
MDLADNNLYRKLTKMVAVTDATMIGEGADDEQVEWIEPGSVLLEAQVGPRVEQARALDSLATTAALPGVVPPERCYLQYSSDYS